MHSETIAPGGVVQVTITEPSLLTVSCFCTSDYPMCKLLPLNAPILVLPLNDEPRVITITSQSSGGSVEVHPAPLKPKQEAPAPEQSPQE